MNETDDIPLRFGSRELPTGEVLLWQGKPHWQGLALDAFHVPWIGIYFLALALWRVAADLHDGATRLKALGSAATLVWPALACMAVVALLAWLTARATMFTVTNRRVLMRFGVALPALVNIPLDKIDTIKLRRNRNGTCDIAFSLPEEGRLFYHQLWPYARGGRLYPAVPTLRALADAAHVGAVLLEAMRVATGQPQASPARTAEDAKPAPVAPAAKPAPAAA